MNITHIIIGLGVGGAEHMLRRLVLAQQVAEPARQCTVISLTSIGPVGKLLQEAGIPVIAMGLHAPWGFFTGLWRLKKTLEALKPDVVQTWMVHADLLGGLAARWVGIRGVIWGIRTTDFGGASRLTRVVRRVCAVLSSRVPHTIVCAAEASRRSHVAIGYDDTRMVVIPNGFDIQRFCPDVDKKKALRAQLGIRPQDHVIGHVGRWNLAKDHLNFVHAAARWAAQNDITHVRFLMVGREVDASNDDLAQAIAESGCAGQFMLLGERSDVPDLLQAMDLFCLSSRTEGFPNVVGEAMATGVPCVVTDVGDAAMMVGSTGWVVPKEDAEALSAALALATQESRIEREKRAALARMRVVQEFSMERATLRFTQLQQWVAEKTQAGVERCAD
ncbi:glycosyltransferase [Leptothrix ochracea]|uniref:glycosyltransferase n=1 Tax=Leptothrix ochracea TaxID=735331 RepID=UPI0034E26B98